YVQPTLHERLVPRLDLNQSPTTKRRIGRKRRPMSLCQRGERQTESRISATCVSLRARAQHCERCIKLDARAQQQHVALKCRERKRPAQPFERRRRRQTGRGLVKLTLQRFSLFNVHNFLLLNSRRNIRRRNGQRFVLLCGRYFVWLSRRRLVWLCFIRTAHKCGVAR